MERHVLILSDQRPAEVMPVALQIEARSVLDDFDRSRAGGLGAGDDVTRAHVPGGQHMVAVEAVELSLEQPDTQAGGIRGSGAAEAVRIAVNGELSRDEAQYAAATPHADIQVMCDGIAEPVPMVGQVERLAREVGSERQGGVNRERQRCEVTLPRQRARPRGL